MPKKPPKPVRKRRRKRKPPPSLRIDSKLRGLIREAARTGLAEAIEHCSNFWNVSDGYKRFIERQIADQAAALIAAVRIALREELVRTRKPKN